MTERIAVRFGIPALLLVCAGGALAVSLHTTKSAIPSFAFGSHVVLAVQVTLLFFYSALLLVVPLVRALTDGALPIELSLKGARWTEDIDGISREVLERQVEAEKKALSDNFEMHREIETLRKSTKEIAGYDDHHGSE